MAKELELQSIGLVKLYKRRGMRSIRLSIAADGSVRVSMPTWVSYADGIKFAQTKQDWISQNTASKEALIIPGGRIGKAHRVEFLVAGSSIKTRLRDNSIVITHPTTQTHDNPNVQKVAKQAAIRALRKEADQLLPQRVKTLAAAYGFTYTGVSTKVLKRRWGSCDNNKHITLNLFLIQLPWQLIDYVILHELAHTKVMNHSKEFWDQVYEVLPDAKLLRKTIKNHQPVLKHT